MKFLVWYWIIGCVLMGCGAGWRWSKCPDEKIHPAEAVVFVATWPMLVGALVTYSPTGSTPKCETRT